MPEPCLSCLLFGTVFWFDVESAGTLATFRGGLDSESDSEEDEEDDEEDEDEEDDGRVGLTTGVGEGGESGGEGLESIT